MGLFSSIASAVGGSVPIVGPIISGLFGLKQQDKANQANASAVQAQNTSNEAIASQNLGFQRENLDYLKALQQKIFDREDSSYSRTVADMRAAGLNPLTMSGTNQAGSVVPTNALNNNYQAAAFTGYQPQDYGFIAQIGQNYLNFAEQKERIKSQQIENNYKSDIAEDRVISFKADALSKVYNSLNEKEVRLFNQRYGINKGMTPDERKAAIVLSLMGVKLNNTYDSAGNDTSGKPYNEMEYSSPRNITSKEVGKAFKNFATDVFSTGKDTLSDTLGSLLPDNPLESVKDIFSSDKSLNEKGKSATYRARHGDRIN